MAKQTVKIELDGDEVELVPSYSALEKISNKYENVNAVFTRVGTFDINAMAEVVVAGVLPKKAKLEETKKAIFEAGLYEMMPKLILFLNLLMNGGKSSEEATSENPESENL